MRILIAEDNMPSRAFLKEFLSEFGECDIAVNGIEAIEMFSTSLNDKKPYALICLDIMMPKLDGIKVLKMIRDMEKDRCILDTQRAKVIMITALNDKKTVTESYEIGCDAYVWKPIDVNKFRDILKKLELI